MPDEIEKIIHPTPGRRLKNDPFFNDGHYAALRAMGTRKEDVGLKDVVNYPPASQAEAEAGELNTRYLTPLTSKQQVDSRLASEVEAQAGENAAKLMTPQRTKQLIEVERKIDVLPSLQILPTAAFVEVIYDTTKTFTIEAIDTTSAGNNIQISFVDPEDVDQALAVSVVEGVIIISHATDALGEISTLAGNLETAINEHAEAGLLVEATMGEAGTMDFVGDVATAGHTLGIVCKKGKLLSDSAFLYLCIADTDGETNQTTDFKKVALIDIA